MTSAGISLLTQFAGSWLLRLIGFSALLPVAGMFRLSQSVVRVLTSSRFLCGLVDGVLWWRNTRRKFVQYAIVAGDEGFCPSVEHKR